jgi:hypothetical protein
MTTSKFRFLWSREKQDVGANLSEAFIPEEQVQTLLSELRSFLIQAEQQRSRYDVLLNGAIWLIEEMNRRHSLPPESDLNSHMLDFASKRGVAPKFRSWVVKGGFEEPRASEHITTLDIESKIVEVKSSGTAGISETCERLREEIKSLRGKARVVDVLISQIMDVSEQHKDLNDRTEIAALRALIWVPIYEATDETKREVLRDAGLGEIDRRIVLIAYPRSKPDYFMAYSEEELTELLYRKESGRVAKEHVSYLRNILRNAFPRSTDTGVSVITQKDREGQCIPITVLLYADSAGSAEIFLRKANQLGFRVSEGYSSGSYRADLSVDVSQLKGDRAKIRDFIRQRLAEEQTANTRIIKETWLA